MALKMADSISKERDMSFTKKQLRTSLRLAYLKYNFKSYEQQLVKSCLTYLNTINYKSIGLFYSLPTEQPTHLLVDTLIHFKSVALPRMYNNDIKFHFITSISDLEPNKYNIMEPKASCLVADELDVVLVPGLLFDINGYRLGYGKGCYDKYLSKSCSNYKLGYCVSFQLTKDVHLVPKESHDVQLHGVITENQIKLI